VKALELIMMQVYNYILNTSEGKGAFMEPITDPVTLSGNNVCDNASAEIGRAPEQREPIPADRFLNNPSKQINSRICKKLMGHASVLKVKPDGINGHKPEEVLSIRVDASKNAYLSHYKRWITKLEQVFEKCKSGAACDFKDVEQIAYDIIDLYFMDRYYCLNIMNLRYPSSSDKYVITHCINVAVAAVGTGALIGCSIPQLRELAAGALLHDIGHQGTRSPLLNKQDLNSNERLEFDDHTTSGLQMLKCFNKVPVSTVMIVGMHHELCNGKGRIYKATFHQQHDFARLIGVVDYFESTCRFHCAPDAVLKTRRAAQHGELDVNYTNYFLSVFSHYPIGVSVRINTGMICKVVAINADSLEKPVLRSVYSVGKSGIFPLHQMDLINLTESNGVKIVEVIRYTSLKIDIAKGF
jgi:HD-GYP domain-containing protein (c-di-GMP phosphodiesterase class II)